MATITKMPTYRPARQIAQQDRLSNHAASPPAAPGFSPMVIWAMMMGIAHGGR